MDQIDRVKSRSRTQHRDHRDILLNCDKDEESFLDEE